MNNIGKIKITISLFVLLFMYFIISTETISKKLNINYIEKESNKNKQFKIDVVIPFQESKVDKLLDRLKLWDQDNKLPCNVRTLGKKYSNVKSDLIFFQNLNISKPNENLILQLIKNSKWSKCFTKVKFVYADLQPGEDRYPTGVTKMFYKYFLIGPKETDYFFWMEPDVSPIKPNWLMELFRTTIGHEEARNGSPFFMLGSNYVADLSGRDNKTKPASVYHINGNAIYWNDITWYNNLLLKVESYDKRTYYFDYDIFLYMHDSMNWEYCKFYFQEFIFYEIIQNLGHSKYSEEEINQKHPRTYFVHS